MNDSSSDPTDGEGRRGGPALSGGAIGSIAGAALLVVFMFQNTDSVTLTLFVWDFTWPVWLLVAFSASIGALVWFGFGVRRRRRRRKERRDS